MLYWIEVAGTFAFSVTLLVFVLALLALLAMLRNALASLGLYMDREECEATVLGRYRFLAVFPRVRYEFWTPLGMVRGTAPASCVRDGSVRVAWRRLHPTWHRPRELMLPDLLNAATLWLSALVIALLHAGSAAWQALRRD